MGGTWSLAIDFGTTATVGTILDDRGQCLAEIDGERSIPSTVAWVDGGLVVGREAERRRVFRPETGAARPKQLLGRRRTILLGDQAVPAHEAVGAILRVVADAATTQQGRAPVATVLTHPVRWSDEQLDQLVAAARTALLPDVHLLPEPVAAAFHVGDGLVDDGRHVAVYDLGGGTFDTAVLTKSAGSFELAGPPGGDDRFGGDDIDARLTATVLDRIEARSTEWAAQLRNADDPLWRHAHAELTIAVRQAKEALSRQTTASVMLGAPMSGDVRVTRPELESLIEPQLRHTLDQFTATVGQAGLSLSDIGATYVTGGASRTPLVARLLHDVLGRPPDTFDDPKAVVAMGANRWLHQTSGPSRDEPGRDDRPAPTPEPVATRPVSVTTDPAAPAPPPPTEPATAETPVWRRRPTATWLVGAALVAGAVAMAVIYTGLIGGGDGADDVTIAIDGTPTGVAFGGGSVWAAVDGSGEVARIEADSNLISSTVAVGDAPLGVAYGEDAVWVIDESNDTVVRVDPATDTVVARVAVGRRPLAVTARGDAVWVANYDDGSVSHIDATRNAVVATVAVGRGPVAISADDDAVWVANGDDNSVSRVDPATNQRQLTIAVGAQPLAIATGAGGVWVASFADQAVLRIDPERNLVAGKVTVGRGPAALALDGDDLWVANSQDDSVMRVDVEELVVVGTQATGSGPAALAVGEGSLWVANAVGRTITRLPTG